MHIVTHLLVLKVTLMTKSAVAKSIAVSSRKPAKHKAATDIEESETPTPSVGGMLFGWPVTSEIEDSILISSVFSSYNIYLST